VVAKCVIVKIQLEHNHHDYFQHKFVLLASICPTTVIHMDCKHGALSHRTFKFILFFIFLICQQYH